MRGSGLSALAASEITPAAVRLHARSVEIEIEIEDMIADGDHMTTEELSAWSDRLLHDDDFDSEAEERKAKAAILAKLRNTST
jgi:porphobilinogen deaminase